MEPHQNEFNLFWQEERTSASPENEGSVPLAWDIADFLSGNRSFGRGGPLPSPTNHSIQHTTQLFAPVLHTLPPTLRIPGLSASSAGNSFQHTLRRLPPSSARSPVSRHHFFEESTSTDATPESSDVEDENRMTKKKRAKTLMSEEQAAKHGEDAVRFPLFLSDLRMKLLNDCQEGRIQEQAAISALIQEFTKTDDQVQYSLPPQCELWLKQASERVHEQRQMSKGMRKKKPSEAAGAAGHERFVCPHCPEDEAKVFKTQEGLNLHIRNKHEPDKQWKCLAPGCTVSFVRQADLRMHLIRMHSPQRPFPCKVPFCLKAFAGVSELRRHVKVDHRPVIHQLCNGIVHDGLG